MIQVASSAPSVLVAIASYGTAQDHYLCRVLAEYRKLHMRVRAVVLSNVTKPVPGAEVVAGLPSPNPYSLPFAHRKLFGENAGDYELFIYSEDDTLITERHIDAFLDAQSKLRDDEIAGFIRSESAPDGRRFITSIHHHFKWQPDSVVERGGESFASLSNQHSGCFIATRAQIQKAIASGGFLVPPHAESYGMLETAASDLYTQCGLRRVISLSRIHDFVVPHLPNKYYREMGVALEDLELQVQALQDLRREGGWTGKLFEPRSAAPGFRWSKDLYERADEELLSAVPSTTQTVLSVGCGSGENETWLAAKGVDVCAVPVDAVFGTWLNQRRIRTVLGPFEEAMERLNGERFDVVLLSNVLHLVDDPVEWLRRLGAGLKQNGRVVASIANTGEVTSMLSDWQTRRGTPFGSKRNEGFVQGVSLRRLRSWCKAAKLDPTSIVPALGGGEGTMRKMATRIMGSAFAPRFILTAARGESSK